MKASSGQSDINALVAAVTMVRDDPFFLEKWVSYYGTHFGRRNLYIINHGDQDMVRDVAKGCNLIAIPDDTDPKFDIRRWRLLNGLVAGLTGYHRRVVVGDVDELVVADPEVGTLREVILNLRGRVVTPFGLEVVHRTQGEAGEVSNGILSERRHARIAQLYAKPCILARPTQLSRGGHYASHDELKLPRSLYLFHLKYCDYGIFSETIKKRNDSVARTGAKTPQDAMIGRHWFPDRENPRDVFDGFNACQVETSFNFRPVREEMRRGWSKRPDTDYWHFPVVPDDRLYRIPDRFVGLF